MIELKFQPRFKDTDALGHINNASYSTWFEEGRRAVFQLFVPDLDPKKWNLIIARAEYDYLAQGQYQALTTIKSWIERIGNSSFVLSQEAHQDDVVVCRGKAVLVHFDYKTQKSVPISEEIKKELSKMMLKSE